MVAPVLDLATWLEAVRADGITDITEHEICDCCPHRIDDWIQEVGGG
jgi:hypothetical protein